MNFPRFFTATYRYSPIRAYEDEALRAFAAKLPPRQKILDLGGGKKSDYAPIFVTHKLDSINISKSMQPTIIGDLMKPLAVKDSTYHAVISLNTFEHIPSLTPVLPESFRALKNNGTLFFTVPFLHHTHGLPYDYARYTSSALELALKNSGFTHIKITPLGHGVFTACSSNLHGFIPQFLKILRPLLCGFAYLLDSFLFALSKKYRAHFGPTIFPLGYSVSATR